MADDDMWPWSTAIWADEEAEHASRIARRDEAWAREAAEDEAWRAKVIAEAEADPPTEPEAELEAETETETEPEAETAPSKLMVCLSDPKPAVAEVPVFEGQLDLRAAPNKECPTILRLLGLLLKTTGLNAADVADKIPVIDFFTVPVDSSDYRAFHDHEAILKLERTILHPNFVSGTTLLVFSLPAHIAVDKAHRSKKSLSEVASLLVPERCWHQTTMRLQRRTKHRPWPSLYDLPECADPYVSTPPLARFVNDCLTF
eukprot:SAG31_NODE_756_length_12303_cov_8.918142_7_plen_259_part_00